LKTFEKISKNYRTELEEISPDYHENVLNLLGDSLSAFYHLRNSEASRGLDRCSGFSEFLKVPDFEYIDTVLENTPLGHHQKELEDQLIDKELSTEEIDSLSQKYNLEPHKEILNEQPTLLLGNDLQLEGDGGRRQRNRNDSYVGFTEEINKIVKKSFGLFYRGDYMVVGGIDGSLSKTNRLEFIARPSFLDPQFGCGVAGLLGDGGRNKSDGSVIIIRGDKKKYLNSAKKYAEIYQHEFGKEVQIKKVQSFEDLILGVGVGSMCPFPKNFGFKS